MVNSARETTVYRFLYCLIQLEIRGKPSENPHDVSNLRQGNVKNRKNASRRYSPPGFAKGGPNVLN